MLYQKPNIRQRFEKYRFEIRHLLVLFIVLILFQLVISFVHKNSIQKFLVKTQEWYQQESAERLANLTTTSLELLLESKSRRQKLDENDVRKIVQDFNIIFSQQLLHQNVQEICLIVRHDSSIIAIDDGRVLYSFAFEPNHEPFPSQQTHESAIKLYKTLETELRTGEQIQTVVEGRQTFHVFVPFAPRGEYVGSMYMRNTPDFSMFTQGMISNFDETTLAYSALILIGLLAMFFISSYTLRERDKAQTLLFQEQKEHLSEQINYQKEMLFTKRIYHTHHKAEKVMGFIKEDLRNISPENIQDSVYRINKYANFVARVIYDMKWYDPPINTIRGPMFATNVNEIITFITDNIFSRNRSENAAARYDLRLDASMPKVAVNEYVVWEVLEPILQNSYDHAGVEELMVTIETAYKADLRQSTIKISDNGKGIAPALLEPDDRGIQRLFLEHISTKVEGEEKHSGYGCYISHQIATQRCGWQLEARNLDEGGCMFTFTIEH